MGVHIFIPTYFWNKLNAFIFRKNFRLVAQLIRNDYQLPSQEQIWNLIATIN